MELIKRIVHPVDGIIATSKGTPSIKEVTDWLNSQPYDSGYRRLAWEPQITLPPEEIVSPEERERRYQRLKEVARVIRETAKAKVVGRPSVLRPTKQIDDPDKRAAAMENLQAMNRGGVDG